MKRGGMPVLAQRAFLMLAKFNNVHNNNFTFLKVHFILNEMIMGGMVLETNLQEIVSRFQEQQKIAKSEVPYFFVVNIRDSPKWSYKRDFQNSWVLKTLKKKF